MLSAIQFAGVQKQMTPCHLQLPALGVSHVWLAIAEMSFLLALYRLTGSNVSTVMHLMQASPAR